MFSITRAAVVLAAVSVAALGGIAAAQDPNARPHYGELTLEGGFTPDPSVVAVTAGGSIAASTISDSCRGFISNAPDVRLNWQAGSLPLIISVASSSDTTLVVNAPDGRWYCDDDGGVSGLNPSLTFNNSQSGRYEIWVGTYRAGANSRGRLHISEVRSQ